MRITGQRAWAAACGAQMFILGVFGTPHRTLAQQIVPGPTAPADYRRAYGVPPAGAVKAATHRATHAGGAKFAHQHQVVQLDHRNGADADVGLAREGEVHGRFPAGGRPERASGF